MYPILFTVIYFFFYVKSPHPRGSFVDHAFALKLEPTEPGTKSIVLEFASEEEKASIHAVLMNAQITK